MTNEFWQRLKEAKVRAQNELGQGRAVSAWPFAEDVIWLATECEKMAMAIEGESGAFQAGYEAALEDLRERGVIK